MVSGGVLVVCALSLLLVSCGGGGGGGSDDYEAPVAESGNTTSESGSAGGAGSGDGIAPTTVGFVLISGGTVTGGDKFIPAGFQTSDGHKGAFVEGRTVTVSPFYICDHEVTQIEYQEVMGTNPSSFSSNPASGEVQANRPVENVIWYEAITYCNKRSIMEGLTPCYTVGGVDFSDSVTVPTVNDLTWNAATCNFDANGYRLPTEVEWEYAARGGAAGCALANPTDYAGTDDMTSLGSYAWDSSNSGGMTHEIKKKTKNSLDLYDMSGNVWELCWDRYNIIIIASTSSYGPGVSFDSSRVIRGGGWNNDPSYGYCSLGIRAEQDTWERNNRVGFRVVRTAN